MGRVTKDHSSYLTCNSEGNPLYYYWPWMGQSYLRAWLSWKAKGPVSASLVVCEPTL